MRRPDFLLLTGDLVNDDDASAYDWLFDRLRAERRPFACVAGNHDATIDDDPCLAFAKRRFLPKPLDLRLMDCQSLRLGSWRLLLLNSSVQGKIGGLLRPDQLAWLGDALRRSDAPALVAMHHHPLPVRSAWIDAHMLKNADEFWKIAHRHRHLRAVVCGHAHQAAALRLQQTRVYVCPAVARQFAPLVDDFALDDKAMGFRILDLEAGGVLKTRVARCKTTPLS